MRKLCLLFFLVVTSLLSGDGWNIHRVKNHDESMWGLMGRKTLGENEGMLFSYEPPQYVSLWMFNCYVDLSVAFLDETFKIVEIVDLLAYPEKMDPERPVNSTKDFARYPYNDPIRHFYSEHGVRSQQPVSYALEMPKGWFKAHGYHVGDSFPNNF